MLFYFILRNNNVFFYNACRDNKSLCNANIKNKKKKKIDNVNFKPQIIISS